MAGKQKDTADWGDYDDEVLDEGQQLGGDAIADPRSAAAAAAESRSLVCPCGQVHMGLCPDNKRPRVCPPIPQAYVSAGPTEPEAAIPSSEVSVGPSPEPESVADVVVEMTPTSAEPSKESDINAPAPEKEPEKDSPVHESGSAVQMGTESGSPETQAPPDLDATIAAFAECGMDDVAQWP